MSGYEPGDGLIRRAAPAAEGLIEAVRRRDAAGIERLLACRRRTEREWYALVIALADMAVSAEAGGVKRCTSCGEPKPFSEFYPNPLHSHGLENRCKPCHLARKRQPAQEAS